MYLQGSYGNHTNIKSNSDVDIVVVFDFEQNRVYNLLDWFYERIRGAGGFNFSKGNKTVKYAGSDRYVKADIVPCINTSQGIMLYDHGQRKIIYNNPKKHIECGVLKNKQTEGQYKEIVRIMKNGRDNLSNVSLRSMPSFKIECMIYSVPNDCYSGDLSDSYYNVVLYLNMKSSAGLLCNIVEPGTGQKVFPTYASIMQASSFLYAILTQLR